MNYKSKRDKHEGIFIYCRFYTSDKQLNKYPNSMFTKYSKMLMKMYRPHGLL